MKIKIIVALAIIFASLFAVMPVQAAHAFNGAHYNLNIIGVQKDKVADVPAWINENRHTIFVGLTKPTNIYMRQGTTDFNVIDANGCDGSAGFELAPGYYEVFAIALGKQNKEVTITPEATFDYQTGEEVFYLGSVTIKHDKKPVWTRVTGMFLVDVCIDTPTEDPVCYNNAWVFSIPQLTSYYWIYDNHGCKLTQVRFYKVDSIPEMGT